jgi:uncharacterized membrane protein
MKKKEFKLINSKGEYAYRSWTKAVSYRVVGSLYSFVVLYLVSGKLLISLSLSAVEVVSKIVIFYYHERIWDKISFGKVKQQQPDYEI